MILPNHIGIIISHYKDLYEPTSIMENNRGFFRGSGVSVFSECTHLGG